MARTKFIQPLCLTAAMAIALSCGDPAGPLFPSLDLTLASQLGTKRDFFEGEPIYVVFSLTNHGADTIWTRPFSFVIEWWLDGDVTDSVGMPLDKWGGIASLITRPGYRGVPLPPGQSRFEVWTIQDRWGVYATDVQNIYDGHNVPPGKYTLRMHFTIDAPGRRVSRTLDADPVTFRVHARDAAEDQSFHRIHDFIEMAFSRDSIQAAASGDSLMAYVQSRAPDDPFLPYLMTAWGWSTRYWTDSTKRELLVNASTAVARAERANAAGAYAIVGVNEFRPSALRALGQELAGSLAGDVATSLADSLRRF